MSETTYDLVVLGAGPGGYVAAIRAAQLGMKTAIVDENQKLGGTCLRVGCIPSKALLESSHHFEETRNHLDDHGISVDGVSLDLATMMKRKDKVVDQLTGGVQMLLKRNKIDVFTGRGRLKSNDTIEVSADSGNQTVKGKKILIATGSSSVRLPGIEFDGDLIGDSTTALSYAEVPKKLIVIGAGYIGLELGSVWNRLGSEVVVLEAMDRILPGLDAEIAKHAHRAFEKQGLKFHLSAWVESAKVESGSCVVRCKEMEPLTADRVLLCTGRVPSTKDIGLEDLNIKTDKRGTIQVDEHFQTNVEGIYAIGDCVPGPMLAHKASDEGIACVEYMATGYGHVNYDAIPGIVYTHPEIATVGKSEEQLKEAKVEYNKGMCPYGANGRALALGDATGRIKILADAKTDRILGVHAIGARAGDLISEAAVAMNFGATSEDIARCCHAHPTLSEIMHEAALAVSKRAIHT
jgi:dihydrolipoamide dehydrogenase